MNDPESCQMMPVGGQLKKPEVCELTKVFHFLFVCGY